MPEPVPETVMPWRPVVASTHVESSSVVVPHDVVAAGLKLPEVAVQKPSVSTQSSADDRDDDVFVRPGSMPSAAGTNTVAATGTISLS